MVINFKRIERNCFSFNIFIIFSFQDLTLIDIFKKLEGATPVTKVGVMMATFKEA